MTDRPLLARSTTSESLSVALDSNQSMTSSPPSSTLTRKPTPSPPSLRQQPSFWERTKQLSDKIGGWSNKQANRAGVEAFYPTSLDDESNKAARILRTFTWDAADLPEESLADRRKSQIVLRKIPPEAIHSSSGLAIFTVFRTGLLHSVAAGSGVVLSRLPDGTWSPPSGVILHTVGFGFLAGVDVYDVVLLLREEKAVEAFAQTRISLGAGISVAAGPVGNGMQLETAAQLSAVWSYTKSKGLYGGVQLDGTVLTERSDENARSYGRKITAEEILNGAIRPPNWCEGLHQTLLAAEGSEFRPELIPQGPSASESFPSPSPDKPDQSTFPPPISPPLSPDPSIMSTLSQSSIRRLPKEELSEEDLAAKRELEEAMRSFGIEDPTVNERSRSEDPLLVVEEKADESFDFENDTPGLTGSRGSRASSASGPTSFTSLSDTAEGGKEEAKDTEHVEESEKGEAGPVGDVKEEEFKSNSIPGSPNMSKPPVPPRRTPRIPAPASPVVGASSESEEKKETQEEKSEELADVVEGSHDEEVKVEETEDAEVVKGEENVETAEEKEKEQEQEQ